MVNLMRWNRVISITVALLFLTGFLVYPTSASATNVSSQMQRRSIDILDSRQQLTSNQSSVITSGGVAAANTEIVKLLVGVNGNAMYAIYSCGDAGVNSRVRLTSSSDAGRSWSTAIYDNLVAAVPGGGTSTNPLVIVWNGCIAPDNSNILAVAISVVSTPTVQNVYISSDGGNNWLNTYWPPVGVAGPAQGSYISCMDISMDFGAREILVGMRNGTGNAANNLWIMKMNTYGGWNVQNACGTPPSVLSFVGDIIDARFSPTFNSDHTIVVLYSIAAGIAVPWPLGGTLLANGVHDIAKVSTTWQILQAHVEIKNANNPLGSSPTVAEIITGMIQLPSDYSAVGPGLPKIFTFTANPLNIRAGDSTTLQWDVFEATVVTIDQGVGAIASNGTKVVAPLAATTYTLTATNSVGSVTATVTVTPVAADLPQIGSFFASHLNILPGEGVILNWNITGATSVSIDQGIGVVSSSGMKFEMPLASATYTLTATNSVGSVTASFMITLTNAAFRRVYICTDAINRGGQPFGPNRGVYRVDDNVIYTLMDNSTTFQLKAANLPNRRAHSISYWGTCASGKLLVGETLGQYCTATVPVWFTDAPTVYPVPTWYPATKMPTGAAGEAACVPGMTGFGNAYVVWSSPSASQGIAYAVTGSMSYDGPFAAFTGQTPALNWPAAIFNVMALDESAFSLTKNNNQTWNQLALIDSRLAIVTTNDATSIANNSATLNGNLASLGRASNVNVSFQWGTVPGVYPKETTPQAKTAIGTFSQSLESLTKGTTYYFRTKAVGDGTSYGDEKSFVTTVPINNPPIIQSVTANPNQLWPANKKPVNVKITVVATDPDGASDIVMTKYSVVDEYGQYNLPETNLPSNGIISLIPDNEPKDKDGRVYAITIKVIDAGGLSATKSVNIVVSNDKGKK